jgi:hypothetical protein
MGREQDYQFNTVRYEPSIQRREFYWKPVIPPEQKDLTSPRGWDNLVDADPRLQLMIKAASKYLPNGWHVYGKGVVEGNLEVTPDYVAPERGANGILLRSMYANAGPHHKRGRAIDIALVTPEGKVLPNIRSSKYYRVYELFAQIVVKCIKENLVIDNNGTPVNWDDLKRGGTGHRWGSRNSMGQALDSTYNLTEPPGEGVCVRWGGHFSLRSVSSDCMHFDFASGGGGGGTFREGLAPDVIAALRRRHKNSKNQMGELLPVTKPIANWSAFRLPQTAAESAEMFRDALGIPPTTVAQIPPAAPPTPPVTPPPAVLPSPPATAPEPLPPAPEPPAEAAILPEPVPAPTPVEPVVPPKPELTLPPKDEKVEQSDLILAITRYKLQIEELRKKGWNLYNKDLTVFDLFYKDNTLVIPTSSNPNAELDKANLARGISCDFISATSFNVFKKLPIQGISMPTAQFLGRADNSFLISFKSLGLDAVRQIEVIKDTLKKQAIQFKFIPESYVLRVENNIINAMGDLYFVINGLDSATVPETPGSYATEMRLTANDIYIKNARIKRQSITSSIDIKKTFIEELVSRTVVNYIKNGQSNPPITTEVACLSDNCDPTPITVTDANEGKVDVSSLANIKDQLFLYWNTTRSIWFNDRLEGLSEGHREFMKKICGTLNLVNRLIIPDGYRYIDRSYRLEVPTNKTIINLFYNDGHGFLNPTLMTDEPFMWMKDYTDRYKSEFLVATGGSIYANQFLQFQAIAPMAFESIAPAYWDFKLEAEHIEYDISELPLRIEAFTFADGEGQSSYADALDYWTKSGDTTTNPIAPYIRSHRSMLGLARNTWFLWMWRCIFMQRYFYNDSVLDPVRTSFQGTPRSLITFGDANKIKSDTWIRENFDYVRRFAPDEIFQEEAFGPNFLRNFTTDAKEFGVKIYEIVKPITSVNDLVQVEDAIGAAAGTSPDGSINLNQIYTIIKPGAKHLFKPWKGYDFKDTIVDIGLVWGGEYVIGSVVGALGKGVSFIIGKGATATKKAVAGVAATAPGQKTTAVVGAVATAWKNNTVVINAAQKTSAVRAWFSNTRAWKAGQGTFDFISGKLALAKDFFTKQRSAGQGFVGRTFDNTIKILAGKGAGFQSLTTASSIALDDLAGVYLDGARENKSSEAIQANIKNIKNGIDGFALQTTNSQFQTESFYYEYRERTINGGNAKYHPDSLNLKDIGIGSPVGIFKDIAAKDRPLILRDGKTMVADWITEFQEIIDDPTSTGWMKLTVPNKYFMDYVWNYLIIPYLNNVFDFESIYKISVETEFFPKTRELLIAQEQSLVDPTYEDLDLPLHPYWNQRVDALGFPAVVNNFNQDAVVTDGKFIANFSRGNSFTEPDFYLYNPSIEGNEEFLRDRQIDSTKLSARWSPQDIFNFGINMQANIAAGDIERLGKASSPLNADTKIGTPATFKNFFDRYTNAMEAGKYLESIIGAWSNEIHNTQAVPKQTPALDGCEGTEEELDKKYPKSKSSKAGWENLRLWLGPNVDLLAPMSMNFDKADKDNLKLRMSTLANLTLKDFNEISGEDYVIKMQTYLQQDYEEFVADLTPQEEADLDGSTPDSNDPVDPSNPSEPPNIAPAVRPRRKFGEADPNANQSKKNYPDFNLYNFFDEDCGSGDPAIMLQYSTERYANLTRLHDGLKSIGRRKLAARRAYPVCKVYLIEEDDIYNKEYIELDEIYTYSKIERLEIADSRKRPSSICRLTFVDPNGVLTGFNQFSKAANSNLIADNKINERRNNVGTGLDFESSNALLRGTEFEQSDIGFVLNAGMKIKVCLGFSNDANKLEEVFLGEITDINLDGSGNKIEVVAQSYGAELIAKLKGSTQEETSKEHMDTFDLLARLMFEPEIIHFGKKKFDSVVSFGEDKSIEVADLAYKEGFAVGGMHNARRKGGLINILYGLGDDLDFNLIDKTVDALENWKNKANRGYIIKPFAGPQDDNLYIPSYQPLQGYYWYDWFGTWTGSLTRDGTARIVEVEDGQLKEFQDKAKRLGIPGIATGISAGVTAGLLYGSRGAVGQLTKTKIGFFLVAAVGFGIVLKAITQAVLTAGYYGIDYLTNERDIGSIEEAKTYQSDILSRHKVATNDKDGYVNSPMLISVYDPDSLIYNVYYSTIWDVFEEMTYRHPSYVKHPRIYKNSNRMTMFFGLPDQNMWEYCGDPLDVYRQDKIFRKILKSGGTLEEDSPFLQEKRKDTSAEYNLGDYGEVPAVSSEELANFVRLARRRFRPFRNWHNLNSYTDIISNDIEATADAWYTEVEIQYSDSRLKNNVPAAVTNPNAFIDWQKDNVVVKKANVDLSPQFIRRTTYQFPNCKSKGMANTYARSILAKQAKEMYKGSLTIMGNPYIKPYDVCILNDTYNNIYGPIEVEEVHHIFSPETGYITQIYPDTFVVEEDVTPYIIFNGLQSSVYTRTEYYMELAVAAFPNWGEYNNMTSEGQYYLDNLAESTANYRQKALKVFEEVNAAQDFVESIAVGSGVVGGLAGGLLGLSTKKFIYGEGLFGSGAAVLLGGAAAASLAYFYASSSLTSIIYNYIAEGRAYMMIPLAREGIPMVAGTNIGFGSGMYKSPGQYIRQYWMDGGLGKSIERADSIMKMANARLRYGASMDNTLLETEFSAKSIGFSVDKMFEDFGGVLADKYLFPSVKKQ